MRSGAISDWPEIHLQRLRTTEAGRAKGTILATMLQRHFVHEGRHAPSQGWYTNSDQNVNKRSTDFDYQRRQRVLSPLRLPFRHIGVVSSPEFKPVTQLAKINFATGN